MLGEKQNKWVTTLFKSIYFHGFFAVHDGTSLSDSFCTFFSESVVAYIYIHLINVFLHKDFHFYLMEDLDLNKYNNIQKFLKVVKEKPEI